MAACCEVHAIKAKDLKALSSVELAEMAAQMLAHISEQSKRIDSQAQAIKWRDAKIESITFQLARLKAWKFGAKTEAMNAEQRAPVVLPDIRIELRRGATTVNIHWPAQGGCDCAAWLREWLR